MIYNVLSPDAAVDEFGDRKFTVLMASDVNRQGIGLEFHDAMTSEIVAEVFYSDTDAGMTVWTAESGAPAEALQYPIEEARKRLPPA